MWGRARLPLTDAEFGATRFTVQPMARGTRTQEEEDSRLPVSHTCFFQLELPRYSSRQNLERQLRTALQHSAGVVDDAQAGGVGGVWHAVERDIAALSARDDRPVVLGVTPVDSSADVTVALEPVPDTVPGVGETGDHRAVKYVVLDEVERAAGASGAWDGSVQWSRGVGPGGPELRVSISPMALAEALLGGGEVDADGLHEAARILAPSLLQTLARMFR